MHVLVQLPAPYPQNRAALKPTHSTRDTACVRVKACVGLRYKRPR